ncbi:PepSY domain-containing protein [Rhodobacteraceae bacterium]|nr:PepSY domain-containing protein [Paracoccaceae bacterium]
MTSFTDVPHKFAAQRGMLRAFMLRLHFYIGVFVGPFIFVAALTGLLYVLTPQIESRLYADALTTPSQGVARSLTDQAEAAVAYLDAPLSVSAVRPATAAGKTTRIMFSDPDLGPSENRTIFIDPVTLAVRGDMTTYGTSGILPFRITLDYLHRNLLLGDWGRYYSELAASWLWVVVLGGVILWAGQAPRRQRLREMSASRRRRWIHGTIGVTLSVVLVFVSVTGLTWSQAGGQRITDLRNRLGWVTPSVSTTLAGAPSPVDQHAGHSGHTMAMTAREDRLDQLDAVAAASRTAGLDSPMLEIRLPKPDQAWMVREYDRSWPTQVDTITLAPQTLAVTSRADFATFTIIPKLVRWGIDAHMGVLFGVPNQIVMALVALGLMVSIGYGYVMWWTRRPAAGGLPLAGAWMRLAPWMRGVWLLAGAAVGWALPVLGLSLLVFVLIDMVRWWQARRRA